MSSDTTASEVGVGGNVVLATGNAGKAREINRLLEGTGLSARPQSDFGVTGAEETGLTFVENAILKARHAARHAGLPAIGDDSGLEVEALQGAPGIYSSRFAGPGADDGDNNAQLLERLEGVADADRRARFVCVMVLLRHADDPTPLICEGHWNGRILHEPRGQGGFGYDPLFLPEGEARSAAELDPAEKNAVSHRAQALKALLDALARRRPA